MSNNTMTQPIVSVIMPTYNAYKLVQHSIDSVIAQTFYRWELIIVDDASTDGTPDLIARHYTHEPRIRLIPLSINQGAATARNTAIAAAEGRYIAFLDCDDLWLPEKLDYQINWMQTHKCVFSFTAYERFSDENKEAIVVGVPRSTNYSNMLKTSVIGCSTVIFDSHNYGKVYMPDVRMRQDFGLWLKLLKNGQCAQGIDRVLTRYRLHPSSMSSNKFRAAHYTWNIYRQVEKLPLLLASWYFIHYSMRGALRHYFPTTARKIGFMD